MLGTVAWKCGLAGTQKRRAETDPIVCKLYDDYEFLYKKTTEKKNTKI